MNLSTGKYMRLYEISRDFDGKIVAIIYGFYFANEVCEMMNKRFTKHSFTLTEKRKNGKQPRKQSRKN